MEKMEKQRTSTLGLGKDYEIDFITHGVFTLPDTETDTETDKNRLSRFARRCSYCTEIDTNRFPLGSVLI